MKRVTNFIVEKRTVILLLFLLLTLACGFFMTLVKVNKDMTVYLPDDSAAKQGLALMSQEFAPASSLRLMLKDVPEAQKMHLREAFAQLAHVQSVSYEPGTAQYNKGAYTLYVLELAAASGSPEAEAAVAQAKELCADYDPVSGGDAQTESVSEFMSQIIGIALLILLGILLLMCDSWLDPALILAATAVAVLLNMGTNILFESISNITYAVAAVLQLVLSMDYSIMLLSRYRQELQQTADRKAAMKAALAKSMAAISGSAVTTIVGMLALVFLSFTIGKDLGLVLAKGVFFSLLCIFTVLPALILLLDKGKTKKKSLHFQMTKVGKFAYKTRFLMPFLIVGLLAGGYFLQNKLEITYTDPLQSKMDEVFPEETRIVVIYENKDEANMGALAQSLAKDENVLSVSSYASTIGAQRSYTEMAQTLGLDERLCALLYTQYLGEKTQAIVFADMAAFLQELATDPQAAQLLPQELSQQLELFALLGSGMSAEEISAVSGVDAQQLAALLPQSLTAEEFAEILSVNKELAQMLYRYYAVCHGDEPRGTISLYDFVSFLSSAQELPLGEEQRSLLAQSSAHMEQGKAQFVGQAHGRMILGTSYPQESAQTFAFLDSLDAQLEGTHYLVGSAAVAREMRQRFPAEMQKITMLTAAAIFIVILFSFRSVCVPAILVPVIQCAVYITMGTIHLQGRSIGYLPLLVVQCILMGATVDYGILLTSDYREARQTLPVRDALAKSLGRSMHTIVTSASILVIVTAVLGFCLRTSQAEVAEILLVISRGALVSTLLVVFVLPSLLAVFDRFVCKKGAISE
ncbi:MAG: MMPL family transporter [Oscillospiraceae bacterium]|nr:MMPL family transporter [Oscillospiraceae bacterium]